jgi:hypothetical protein
VFGIKPMLAYRRARGPTSIRADELVNEDD